MPDLRPSTPVDEQAGIDTGQSERPAFAFAGREPRTPLFLFETADG